MNTRGGKILGILALAMLTGCGTGIGGTATEPTTQVMVVATEAVPVADSPIAPTAGVVSTDEPVPSETPLPPGEPAPSETPLPPDVPEPSAAPEEPSGTPIEAIATLVAVQFGTFPQETNADGEIVAWNELVRTAGIPNAGFFVANAPEGVEVLSLDCQIVFNGEVVYQRQAPATDLTLFGQENLQGDLVFADFGFVWPGFDGNGTNAAIVSGEYELVLRGETSGGTTVAQSIPFTIDLDAAPTEAATEETVVETPTASP